MFRPYLKHLSLLIFLSGTLACFSQSFLPVCKNFGVEDYTEDAEFRCAVSDNEGTTYFGTNFGILVYRGEKKSSGKSWKIMRLPAPDIISSLYLDSATKRLYVGGQNDFGYFLLSTNKKDSFISFRKQIPSSYNQSAEVWHIYKQNSQFVFHTLHALLVYEEGKKLSIINSPVNGIFHNVFRVNENTLLINSLENGWFLFERGLKPITSNTEMPIDRCYSVLSLKEKNKCLFFFRNAGVFEASIANGIFSEIKKVSEPGFDKVLSEKQLYGAIFNDDSTKVILATLTNGALLVNYTNTFQVNNIISETQNTTNILSVYGLYKDKLKNTWVLGKSNLSVLPSDLSLIHKDFRGITINGLAVLNQKLYVSATNGLYCLSLDNKLFSSVKKLADGSFNKLILVNDTVYAYNSNEILTIFGEKTQRHPSPSKVNHLANINGKLWISCEDGLYIGLGNLTKHRTAVIGKNVLQTMQVKNAIYVLVQDVGLFECDGEGKIIAEKSLNKDFTSTRNAKLFNADGQLLISNLNNTFYIKNNTISVLDTNRLWLYKSLKTGKSIKFEYDIVNVTSLKIKESTSGQFVNTNSFMSPVEVNDIEFFNDYYYVATKNGLCISKLVTNKPDAIVHILKLTTDSLIFSTEEQIKIPYEESKKINIYCSLNSFYSSFDNTKYSYRLLNYTKEWMTQSHSDFSLNYLPWGNYTLEVKVKYGNNQESKIASLQFIIVKPWWATVWAILGWCALFILFVYTLVQISVYRLKKSKIKLEHIVEERTAEVVSQKKEIEGKKEELENKNHEITDSINYAQRIQNSLLKGEDKLQATLPGAFVLYLPKDIVSGDFYWFTDVLHYHIIAAADCTGHGVPGAFMSMLGVAKLNELAAKEIYMPDKLLHELNHLIVETLGQKMVNSDSRDGMDAAIICVDKKNNKIYYAGANRPLYLINKKENTFTEIKPTKLPVGGGQYGENRDYQLHEIDITGNLAVYLSTDGYADQFGGPKGKKFMTNQLHRRLQEISSLKPDEQKNKLAQSYLAWKGNLEQVDDVCLVGINFTGS